MNFYTKNERVKRMEKPLFRGSRYSGERVDIRFLFQDKWFNFFLFVRVFFPNLF